MAVRALPLKHYRIGMSVMSQLLHHIIASGPRPVAPFSHAVEADGWIFVTGQMPTNPAVPDAPLPDGIEAQIRRVVENLKLVLGGIGLGLEHVTMVRIYLTQFERDYAALNILWPEFFEVGKLPARTTVGVTALAVGALVEIDLVAKRP
jgi:enamine deaminase RidA (YjgF/YER057c/UK114 family)